jgi:hypothetical protein
VWLESDEKRIHLEPAANAPLSDAQPLSQLWLAEQMLRLDGFLTQNHHRDDTTTDALGFDEDRGCIFTWAGKGPRFAFATDADMRQLLQLLDVSQEQAQEILLQVNQILRLSYGKSAG